MRHQPGTKRKSLLFATALIAGAAIFRASANPEGLVVQGGSASAVANGSRFIITASQNAFLNWQSFNIAPGETTIFQQPSAASVVWNKINGQSPAQIWGNLQANGVVVLMNESGFFFGPNSKVSVAGLVASTAMGVPIEFGGGSFWQFNGPPPEASIVNYGQINAGRGGSVFFIAERIQNHGSIIAPEGSIGLSAGQEVLISERPDGKGLSARVRLPGGSVDNTGRLIADAGTIAIHAQVVNQDGMIQADSMRERNGVIELVAAESVTLGSDSVLQANGDSAGRSSGGQITIKSGHTFTDVTGSRISIAGGAQSGDGGSAEISAPIMNAIDSQIDGRANNGTGGRLVIDPTDIVIGNSGTGSAPTTLQLNVNSGFLGLSRIDLQATHNISLATGATWDLVPSTGIADLGSHLTLEAGNDLVIANGASIVAGAGWSVSLCAGRDFSTANTVKPGVGSIAFQGSGSLAAQDGSVTLLAGKDVTVGSGFVRTAGGGSIAVTAVSGSVTTGRNPNGYDFLSGGYAVNPNLGGMSSANGGEVNITAGLDIISYMPAPGNVQTDAGSGAFGRAAGNVTLNAGRDVTGHYVVANGVGTINAGHDAGTSTKLLALSLVEDGWTVNAAQDIFLQEVRNPNGIFNNRGFGSSTTKHLFDYSPGAYTILDGGNSVQLVGAALPRYSDAFDQGIPAIYPGRLVITAGAGGVLLGNDVTLFPSPQGNLTITTTAGGSLVGTKPGDLVNLIMSDSGKAQYGTAVDFGVADHAAVPLHLGDLTPVQLSIAGNLSGILVAVPKQAEITVGGNLVNSRFDGQNLHPGDVTRIKVTGDILNRNEFTSVPLTSAPDFTVFSRVYPPLSGILAGLPNLFLYDSATGTLTFRGRMSGDVLQTLLNLQTAVLDVSGNPVLDSAGNPIIQPVQFISPEAVQQLYANSQDIPANPDSGYRIGGGGQFALTAHNLDLGATAGIVSQGPRENPALANYFTHGASLNVNLSGNLDMFSTTISSLNGGEISVTAGGNIKVGSRSIAGNDSVARGIFTVDQSDVTVVAGGDISVNGSRIAAYDGGNVTVRSLTGKVDAGTGANGYVAVEKIYVDPATRQILTYIPAIPGSGILATTFPPSLDPGFPASRNLVGNILVETPRGSIIASAGGIVQVPLNGIQNNDATVTLTAGTRDASGNVQYVGNIDATGSGVIGSKVKLDATGNITGVVFARVDANITAHEDANVTVFAEHNVSVNAGGTISGTIIGLGGINASGSAVDAALLSQNVSASGNVASAQIGFAPNSAASAASQGLQNDAPAKMLASAKAGSEDEDPTRKQRSNLPRLTKTTGRVTVILPPKTNAPRS
ncbi:MAG: filamentous hemagglutinin N-terminal domain-containing protein [Verrucomicrobiota bacterium]